MGVDLSYLQPYFEALNAVPHLLNQQQQAEEQQAQLAETKRHNVANEDIEGRHADIAEGAARQREQQTNLENAATIASQGWKPLTTGEDGQAYDMSAGGAPVPGSIGLTQGMTTPVTSNVATVGGQKYQIPTWQEQHARTLQQGIDDDAARYGARLNREGMDIPDDVSDTLGIPRGQKILPEHMNALAQVHNLVAPPEKQFKPEPEKSVVTLSPTDAKLMGMPAGTKVPLDEYKARGTVAAEASRAARGDGAGDGEKPLTNRDKIGITNTYVNGLRDSEKQMNADREKAESDKRKGLADAALIKDPTAKASAIREVYDGYQRALDGAAAQHKGRAKNLSDAYTTNGRLPAQNWADSMPDKAPAGAPAAGAVPPPAQGGGRGGTQVLTDTAKAAEYLKKAGGDKDAARKLAAADGWKF